MTNAELTIMTLLAERSRHGYEIEQVIEDRGMREWTEIGFSSIYYILRKLEDAGLVVGAAETAGRAGGRKVYALTPAGRQALRVGALEALAVPRPRASPLLLGVANLPQLPPADAATALREYHTALERQLERVQAQRARQQPLPFFVDAIFDHAVTLIQAERDWIGRFLQRLHTPGGESDADTTDRAPPGPHRRRRRGRGEPERRGAALDPGAV